MSEETPAHPQFKKEDWPLHNSAQLDELRRLDREAKRLTPPFRADVSGEDVGSWEDAGGTSNFNTTPQHVLGRITGQFSGGGYPWYSFSTETFYNGGPPPSLTVSPSNTTFTYMGGVNDPTTFNALELNGNEHVPVGSDSAQTGAICLFWPLEDGQSWGFFYQPPNDTTFTLTTTDNVNTDPDTSTITVGYGLKYSKGTGGSAGNDTFSSDSWTLKVKLPPGGIQACASDSPGSATCSIYTLQGGVLTDTGSVTTVFNNSYAPTPGTQFDEAVLGGDASTYFAPFSGEGMAVQGGNPTFAQPNIDIQSADTTLLTVTLANDNVGHIGHYTLRPVGGTSVQINTTSPTYKFNLLNLVAGTNIKMNLASDTPSAGVFRSSDTITSGLYVSDSFGSSDSFAESIAFVGLGIATVTLTPGAGGNDTVTVNVASQTLKGYTGNTAIPACVSGGGGDTPGTATIAIYYLLGGVLLPTGSSSPVFNNAFVPVPAYSYVDIITEPVSGGKLTTFDGEGFEHNDDSTTLFAAQIADFQDNPGNVSFSVTQDAPGHRAKIKATAPASGITTGSNALSTNYTLTASDTVIFSLTLPAAGIYLLSAQALCYFASIPMPNQERIVLYLYDSTNSQYIETTQALTTMQTPGIEVYQTLTIQPISYTAIGPTVISLYGHEENGGHSATGLAIIHAGLFVHTATSINWEKIG